MGWHWHTRRRWGAGSGLFWRRWRAPPPPDASDNSATIDENGSATGDVLVNDHSPSGTPLTVTEFSLDTDGDGTPETFRAGQPAYIPGVGHLVINPNGSYSFTPAANYNGPVPTASYTISDGNGGTATADLIITVNPLEDPPEAVDDPVSTPEDTPVNGNLLTNDDDPDSDPLTVTEFKVDSDGTPETYTPGDTVTINDPSGNPIGELTVNPNGDYYFDPAPNYNGNVPPVTYTTSDGNGGTDTGELIITVDPVNDAPPVAVDDTTTTDEDTPATGNLLTNDTDVDGDPLTVTEFQVDSDGDGTPETYTPGDSVTINDPGGNPIGELTVDPNGDYSFDPAPNYNGPVPPVTYTVDDGNGGADTGELTITIDPLNDTPVPQGSIVDQTNIDADSSINVPTAGAFDDVDGDTLTYSASGLPPGLSIDTTTGLISGAIDPSASQGGPSGDGQYSVTVTAEDPDGETTTQTFTWDVTNPAPTATDNSNGIAEDATGPATGNVLTDDDGNATDSDPDGDTLTVTGVAGGDAYGTLTWNPDGGYSYAIDNSNTAVQALAAGETLSETYTYTVSDGEDGTDTATLTITVTGTNDVPEAVGTIAPQTNEDADSITSLDVTTYFDDVDGDTLTYSASGLPPGLSIDTTTGLISGTIDPSASQGGPSGDGQYSVTVTAEDPDGETTTQTFTWDVTNPAPTATNNDNGIAEDATGPATGNVLTDDDGTATDSDPDGDALTVTGFTGGDAYGTLTLNPDGGYSYAIDNTNTAVQALATGETLTESYTYTVSDGEGGTDTATLTITVTGTNDAPTTVVTIGPQANEDADSITSLDVTTYFDDVDGDTLTYSASGLPPGLSIDTTTGLISGAIDPSASQGGPSSDGQYSVTVTAEDPDGETTTQTFTWDVTNPAPTATDDSATTNEDTVVSGNVITDATADSDPDGDTLSVTEFTIDGQTIAVPAGGSGTATLTGVGTLRIGSDGSYTFTPEPDYDGPVPTATYTLSDGEGGTDTADLTIDITAANDAPVPQGSIGDQTDADADDITSLDVTTYFDDVDGDTLTYSASGLPPGLSIDTTTGLISGTIDPSASQGGSSSDGQYSVTVTAEDPDGETTTQTFTWDVTNPAPTTTDDSATTNEDTPVSGNVITDATADSDPDGDTLSVTGFEIDTNGDGTADSFTAGDTATITGVGTLTINSNGSYTFTPVADYDGPVPVASYAISDGEGGMDTATLTLTIDAVPDAVDDAPTTLAEGSNTVSGNNLTTNDDLADNARVHQITYTQEDGSPSTVTIPDGGNQAVDTQYGSLTVNSDGTWNYTSDGTSDHSTNNDLSDDFSYTLIDDDGDISNSATQPITVTDTVPAIGTPMDGAVDEAHLPQGSDPDGSEPGTGPSVTSGSLNVAPSADTVDTQLSTSSAPAGLTSGGVAVEYVLSADGHTLVAYRGTDRTEADKVFTVTLNNPTDTSAGYTFTLQGDLDHGGDPTLDLGFDVTVTDSDGDTVDGSLTVTVNDDVGATASAQTVDEDGTKTFNATADATPDNTTIIQNGTPIIGTDNGSGGKEYVTEHGTVTVNADGTITYVPDPHYSGEEEFTYETTDGATTKDTTVTMTVAPLSDAPTLTVDNAAINTLEDTAVALGLNAPVIVDDTDQNAADTGDNPELLGAIMLSGFPDGAVLLDGSGGTLHTFASGDNGTVTIVLDGGPSEAGASGDLFMTRAEFEAMQVKPPTDAHENFTVNMSVSSFEVDDSGNKLSGVSGAQSNTSVEVNVQAVTDNAVLTFDETVTTGIPNALGVTYGGTGGDTEATVTLDEDTSFDVTDILESTFGDLDGSEVRSFTITNNTGQTIVVDGQTVANGAATTIDATGQTGGIDSFPPISIGADGNFSGDLNGIDITLNAQDKDADGFVGGSNGADGVAEADTSDNSVTLNLQVNPVADDVTVTDQTTAEDTAVAFLAGVGLTDTGTGTETIDSVSFELPAGWEMTPPADTAQFELTGSGTAVDPYVITFTAGVNETDRETILDGFTIQPPAHSSADATISLDITTTDSNTVGGSTVGDTQTTTHDVVIEVTPKAEKITTPISDTDDDGTADLAMNSDHAYSAAGQEDQWFDLNQNAANLKAAWSSQDSDSSEDTFARLTPDLVLGDGSQANAIGSQFRWSEDGGSNWEVRTYTGTAIDVPIEYLDTLQFKAAPDFSGQFKITVKAYTRDTDPDDGTVSEAVTGSAELTNLVVNPVADNVTLALNGRAGGVEDNDIPLTIDPTSSDPSETFNVTIADIPLGATVTYGIGAGTQTFTATAGNTSWTIPDFDSSAPLTIQPPENSNEDFTLQVSAESVDWFDTNDNGAVDAGEEVTQSGPQLGVDVSVTGEADQTTVTPLTPSPFSESTLDAGTDTVKLSELATITPTDTDGSEVLTVRVTGLPEGFSPSAGILTNSLATGGDRVWVLTKGQFDTATVQVPDNYSGTIDFQVTPVTTENDGDSLTGTPQNVQFTVTPSSEATMTTSATVVEDVTSPVDLSIVHNNGDTDETLKSVRIEVSDATGSGFTLYLDDGTNPPVTLADALASGDISQVNVGGIDYYVLDATQAGQLAAQGDAQKDGTLGSFDFQYQITDEAYGTTPAGQTVTSGWRDGTFTLDATPVTDTPVASITQIAGAAGTTIADAIAGDDASPDTATLTQADTVTVTMNIDSPDTDGSEHLIRVVIDGVPSGVTVNGAEFLGGGQWLLVYEDANALPIDQSGGIQLPVEFDVSGQADLIDQDITMTTKVQDRGDQPGAVTTVETDSVTWHLETNFGGTGSGEDPAVIDQWAYNDFDATEDSPFTLSDMIDAQVTVQNTAVTNMFTITLTDLPPGTVVTGMTHTVVNGQSLWSASTTSTGGNAATALQNLMDSVTVTPPANANNNNAAGSLVFDAALTTSVVGGGDNESATITPTVPVTPVTDPAIIDIQLDTGVETGELNESDTSIPITLTVTNTADGTFGTIVDGKLYLQVSSTEGDLGSGTLTVGGVAESLEAVTGMPGLPTGSYYVIDNVNAGDTLDLVYTPSQMTAGDVNVDAWVQNTETGGTAELASGSGTLTVNISNDGATVTTNPVTGNEAANSDNGSLVELTGLGVALNDADGSEQINSILLSNLPNGFLIYTGADQASATLANNAGGSGGLNTWVLSDDGSVPAYIGILPPPYWSGTLADLKLLVESGEATLSETRQDSFDLADVTVNPVANGVVITPTNTFGQEGKIIALNLNASMPDSKAPVTGDTSTETTTLKISGLGEHASFYIGTTQLGAGQVSYNSADGSYTITDLSQSDLNNLGFVQAQSALTDQDTGTDGLQLGIEAWTVESGNGDTSASSNSPITVDMSGQLATTGDDTLLWTGGAIGGQSGADTVVMRQGESLSGADLAAQLGNIETIDMGIAGANQITDLTPDQVQAMVDSNGALTIQGDAQDTLSLDGDWVDHGNGTWTGTTTGSDTVTLTVDGGVGVTPPPAGFAAMSLGLDNVAPSEPTDGTAFMFDAGDAGLPTLDSLLSPTSMDGANGLNAMLPGQDESDSSLPAVANTPASGAAPVHAGALDPSVGLPDDELQQGLATAHMVG